MPQFDGLPGRRRDNLDVHVGILIQIDFRDQREDVDHIQRTFFILVQTPLPITGAQVIGQHETHRPTGANREVLTVAIVGCQGIKHGLLVQFVGLAGRWQTEQRHAQRRVISRAACDALADAFPHQLQQMQQFFRRGGDFPTQHQRQQFRQLQRLAG